MVEALSVKLVRPCDGRSRHRRWRCGADARAYEVSSLGTPLGRPTLPLRQPILGQTLLLSDSLEVSPHGGGVGWAYQTIVSAGDHPEVVSVGARQEPARRRTRRSSRRG